ncbi:unnamed protein product [Amoebophrya sp. A120]|nr:unnamed protein product [Amoebophrya sp. A120]|eukprot:GSA120T00021158001.1
MTRKKPHPLLVNRDKPMEINATRMGGKRKARGIRTTVVLQLRPAHQLLLRALLLLLRMLNKSCTSASKRTSRSHSMISGTAPARSGRITTNTTIHLVTAAVGGKSMKTRTRGTTRIMTHTIILAARWNNSGTASRIDRREQEATITIQHLFPTATAQLLRREKRK